MLYFDILTVLKNNEGKQFSALEMFAELPGSNYRSVNRELLKMTLNTKGVFRIERVKPVPKSGTGTVEYVYFFKRFVYK